MGKHTPGPWHVFVDNREDRDGLIYVAGYNIESATTEVVGIEGIAAQDNAEANARLIAAAPELLDALRPFAEFERVRSLLGGNSPKAGTLWGVHTSGGEAEITVEQMRAAMAAIAKATGETP